MARDTIVALKDGAMAGVRSADGAIRAFKGVPFARPPIAELRWKPPQPVEPWTGIRRADSFGPRCVQVHRPRGSIGYFPPEPESEDCLYLNIWTAAREADERRPVMVWFHGGANYMGSGALPIFSGEGFARKGIVLVTVNYRLGRLGFLAHPDLTRESGRNSSGNYGLMDQLAALAWVRDNIMAFGGDPDRVTIFGQSAGSYSVSYFMAAPAARGLFHRAIGQSGGGFGPVGASAHHGEAMQTLEHAERSGLDFARLLGASSIADLRARSAYDIQMIRPHPDGDGALFDRVNLPRGVGAFDTAYPIVDGDMLPSPVRDVFARGAQHDVPLITGTTAHERATTSQPVTTVAAYAAMAQQEFGALADRFLQLYPAYTDAEVNEIGGTAIGDHNFTWQNWTWARAHARKGTAPVYYYRFNHVPPTPPDTAFVDNPRQVPRAFHTADIPYIFQTLWARDWPWLPADHQLSEMMSSYWTNFAARGDPNGTGLPAWPAFKAGSETAMLFNDVSAVGPVPDLERLAFWDGFYGYDARTGEFAKPDGS